VHRSQAAAANAAQLELDKTTKREYEEALEKREKEHRRAVEALMVEGAFKVSRSQTASDSADNASTASRDGNVGGETTYRLAVVVQQSRTIQLSRRSWIREHGTTTCPRIRQQSKSRSSRSREYIW
jgi:hypothetical protein